MKIWFFGKVYDLDVTSIDEVENDIKKRLKDFTHADLLAGIDVKPNEYTVSLGIFWGLKPNGRSILEPVSYFISGEGYDGFIPEYRCVDSFAHWTNVNYYLDLSDFKKACKNNVEYYTGDSVKKVEIKRDRSRICLLFKVVYQP